MAGMSCWEVQANGGAECRGARLVREGARVVWCPETSSRGEAKQPRNARAAERARTRGAKSPRQESPDPLAVGRECRAPIVHGRD
jgi:hypothetical protein